MSPVDSKTDSKPDSKLDSALRPGFEGVVFTETRISHVDGLAGRLTLAGYAVEELAPKATFEEATLLLWTGRRPSPAELESFRAELAARRVLPAMTLECLRQAAVQRLPAMDVLRLAADSLALQPVRPAAEWPDFEPRAFDLLAQMPLVVAAYHHLLAGHEPLSLPSGDWGIAASLLYLISGEIPSPARVRALETYLVTVCDHGTNASTLAARVIVSTRSDLLSAVVGAIGALKGPLHGGAPGPALEMVFDIGQAERAEPYLRAKLAAGERLMGFGHRVYKVHDPRAAVLAAAAEQLFAADADRELYALARHVEATAIRLLDEFKPGRHLRTNVEFYTALLLHGLGLPTELFTPLFAVARTAGWIAHCREQQLEGRLLRPAARYVGPFDQRWEVKDLAA